MSSDVDADQEVEPASLPGRSGRPALVAVKLRSPRSAGSWRLRAGCRPPRDSPRQRRRESPVRVAGVMRARPLAREGALEVLAEDRSPRRASCSGCRPSGVPLPSPPGAPTSTVVAPKFEKSERAPVVVTAATQMSWRSAACTASSGWRRCRCSRCRPPPRPRCCAVSACCDRRAHGGVAAAGGPAEAQVDHAGAVLARRTRFRSRWFALLPLPSASSTRTGMIFAAGRHACHALAVSGDRPPRCRPRACRGG